MDNKLLFLDNGKIIISKILSSDDDSFYLENPMIVEYKYNTENSPVFRYLPWQILSDEKNISIDKNKITMIANPKTELLDVYESICISFIPIEDSEED